MNWFLATVFLLCPTYLVAISLDSGPMPVDDYFVDTNGLQDQMLYESERSAAEASEPLPGPLIYGHKYMTGGAGEGLQQLADFEGFQHRQEVKTDAVLPAYCEPPNPCPVGYRAADGCMEEFTNTAEFSRDYQAAQQCTCDQEHMWNCRDKDDDSQNFNDILSEYLSKNGIDAHDTLIAKKFHGQGTFEQDPRK